MNTKTFEGQLEIDYKRGVIYFHDYKQSKTLLRICRLPEIPEDCSFIDITHMYGVSYTPPNKKGKEA